MERGFARMEGTIYSINVGRVQPLVYLGKEEGSAICKERVDGPVLLTTHGFVGDEQGDKVNHGGRDQAVCVYPFEHYAHWFSKYNLPEASVAIFGENLTVRGLVEEDACIGDIFQLGEAIVQVSQPRQPCYKVAAKWNIPEFANEMVQTGYTGYYVRVLQEGTIHPSDTLKLIKRDANPVSIASINAVKYHDKSNVEQLRRFAAIPELSATWRKVFKERLQTLV